MCGALWEILPWTEGPKLGQASKKRRTLSNHKVTRCRLKTSSGTSVGAGVQVSGFPVRVPAGVQGGEVLLAPGGPRAAVS